MKLQVSQIIPSHLSQNAPSVKTSRCAYRMFAELKNWYKKHPRKQIETNRNSCHNNHNSNETFFEANYEFEVKWNEHNDESDPIVGLFEKYPGITTPLTQMLLLSGSKLKLTRLLLAKSMNSQRM